jgi:hypothetical protein
MTMLSGISTETVLLRVFSHGLHALAISAVFDTSVLADCLNVKFGIDGVTF